MIQHSPRRVQPRNHAVKLQDVPTFSPRIANALKERQDLTPDEEAIADAEIAAATAALRARQIEAGKRSTAPLDEEEFDDV